jgi:lipopolysaccharide/colanic/teichoic acid biosynthesis glycosyltransferase
VQGPRQEDAPRPRSRGLPPGERRSRGRGARREGAARSGPEAPAASGPPFALVARPPIAARRPGYERGKRAFDLAVTLAALPLLLPLAAVCALAIWLDDGRPILFTQLRTGRGGRRFRMFKFRTMVRNALELRESLLHLNEHSGPDFKIRCDPRVTRVGAFLRRTSLDELPQVVNVLRGEMSLVGPRPTSFAAETYSLWQTERLEVTPGVTGLWQVAGRGDVDFHERVRLDVEYVERRGFWFDLGILLRTALAVFRQRGAY